MARIVSAGHIRETQRQSAAIERKFDAKEGFCALLALAALGLGAFGHVIPAVIAGVVSGLVLIVSAVSASMQQRALNRS